MASFSIILINPILIWEPAITASTGSVQKKER
jgi:hypothetical protein